MASQLVRHWVRLLGQLEQRAAKVATSSCLVSGQKVGSTEAIEAANLSNRQYSHHSRSSQSVYSLCDVQKQGASSLHHHQTAGLATSALKQGSPPSTPKLGLSSLVLLAPCGITLFLGLWQLQRREEKIAMLAERQQKLAATPVSLQELLANKAQAHKEQNGSPNAGDLEYRRVQLTGTYDTSRSLYVGPRVKSAPGGMTEKGYHVVTPLVPSDKQAPAVLVNRGWVPNDWREEKEGATSGGEVTVCGVVRGSDQPSQFVPANVPEAEQWFYIDIPRMGKECGIREKALLIEATSDVGSKRGIAKYPEPRDPLELARFKIMPQDHLNYAMTWLTLFAAVSTMAYMRLFGKSSRRKQVVLKYKDGT